VEIHIGTTKQAQPGFKIARNEQATDDEVNALIEKCLENYHTLLLALNRPVVDADNKD
jgi:hypothetical protein